MRAESFQMNVRDLLRWVLHELDVAEACLEEIRFAVRARASANANATAAAMSLYGSWARAGQAVESLEHLDGGGGASLDFARDALCASRRAGARAVAELLTMVRDNAPQSNAAGGATGGDGPAHRRD